MGTSPGPWGHKFKNGQGEKTGFDRVVLYPAGGKDYATSKNRCSYTVPASTDGSDFPTYVPTRFAVTLGAGVDAPAPLRHVAATAVPTSTKLNYSGSGPREG